MPQPNAMTLFLTITLAACGRNPVDDGPDSGPPESTTTDSQISSSDVGSSSPGWSSTTIGEMGSSTTGVDGIGSTTSGDPSTDDSSGDGSSGSSSTGASDSTGQAHACEAPYMLDDRCWCDGVGAVDPTLCGCALAEVLPGITGCLCNDSSEYPQISCGWPCVDDGEGVNCHCGNFPSPPGWCL